MQISEYKINEVKVSQFYNEKNKRYIKLENLSSQTQKKIILIFYIGSIKTPVSRHICNLSPNCWFIPNCDLFGFTHFELYINDNFEGYVHMIKEKNKIPIEDKIFCLGLNKTATTSIAHDLDNLGVISYPRLNESKYNGFLLNLFNDNIGTFIDFVENSEFMFFNDVPISITEIGKKLIRYTPNSKFILSVRSKPELWVNSVKKFFKDNIKNNELNPYVVSNPIIHFEKRFTNYGYLAGLFESWDLNRFDGSLDEKLYKYYLYHNKEIRKQLIKYNCEWIEIDVTKEGELKRLTDFLGIYNTKENFSHLNKTPQS